ncbi:hypothetical protein NC652_027028 [Populus alba x Populus x berolinensis]|nr:hypothetical protein NC652_027028 [Populus alba x Populus x berolinensis]
MPLVSEFYKPYRMSSSPINFRFSISGVRCHLSNKGSRMATSFDYWNDCVDVQDLEAMWQEPEVSTEWLDAGETKGNKVHLSRDPDGEPYLTQTEMKAVADIIVRRHFDSQIQPDMICAVAELASDRQPLSTRWYDKKTKETALGIMQILPKTAEWLVRDRSEEFVVRAYNGGTKKATHKSTLQYWKQYLSVKESLPSRRFVDEGPSVNNAHSSTAQAAPASQNTNTPSSEKQVATQETAHSEPSGVLMPQWKYIFLHMHGVSLFSIELDLPHNFVIFFRAYHYSITRTYFSSGAYEIDKLRTITIAVDLVNIVLVDMVV